MNPGRPQPAMAPPPPPPPRQSSTMKWVLLGCGCLFLLVAVPVGGCFACGYYVVGKLQQLAKAWETATAEGEKYLKSNKHVEQRLGKVSRAAVSGSRHGTDPDIESLEVPYKLTGEKGTATAHVRFKLRDMKPVLDGGTLFFGGKKIDLETGTETDDPSGGGPEEGDADEMTSKALAAAYRANEVAADKKYKGKTLTVSGRIELVKKDMDDRMYVALEGETLRMVDCHFGDDAEAELAELRKGQRITVRGRCDGLMGSVHLRECEIVRK